MQDMNAFKLQLQMHNIFFIFESKTLNTDIWNYLKKKMKRYFKCEIKTASRWQQLAVSESLRLNRIIWIRISFIARYVYTYISWLIQERTTVIAQRRKTVLWLFGSIFVGEIEQKWAIFCLKSKSININFVYLTVL